MSSDIEHFYVQRNEPSVLLPGHVEWEDDGDEYIARRAAPSGSGPAVRDPTRIEPINPGAAAWALMDEVFDAVGGALGGATSDVHDGRPIAWEHRTRRKFP